jgi:uncharacterized protein (TIGR00297 family)
VTVTGDLTAVLYSFLYVGAVVAVGEVARRRFGVPQGAARKFIHVAVGLWVFGTLALFESRWLAAVPPAAAIAANYLSARLRLFRATAEKEGHWGTVWFPVSFTLLVLLAWERPDAILAGILAMALGDAAAEAVGARWGRHPYRTWGGGTKSWEGSAAMAAVTCGALLLVGLPLPLAVLAAIVAAVAEALGPLGLDNLFVPLSAGAVVYFAQSLPAGALAAGAAAALLIGLAAHARGALSPSGVLGALLTGTLLFGLGPLEGAAALIVFFVTATALGRALRHRTAALEREYAKTGRRDLAQALANGGVAALCAIAFARSGEPVWAVALAGALAAANADTWATEIGGAFGRAPRLITTLRPAPPGASGAVTLAGLAASAGGAALIAATALLTALAAEALGAGSAGFWLGAAPAIIAGGVAGSLIDSLLGAAVQAIRWCEACGKETERRIHHCGAAAEHRRGLRWIGNDEVNLLATAAGAAVSGLLFLLA